jgi:hypothetical protein
MAPVEEKALYVGEAGNCLADGTPLIPGETIALVPFAEAEHSDLWEPVTNGKPASPAVRNAPPPPPEPDPLPEAA